VKGVTIEVINAQGVAVDPSCLLAASQQNQTTGADGFYRFDRAPGSPHATCPAGSVLGIRIKSTPEGYVSGFSTRIPPRTDVFNTDPNPSNCTVDAVSGGSFCEVQAQGNAPKGKQSTVYFTHFELRGGDKDIINNHIPLDPIIQKRPELNDNVIMLSKSVNKKQVSVGGQLYYTVTAENTTNKSLDIDIRDDLPTGFKFTGTTAKLVKSGEDGKFDAVDYQNAITVTKLGSSNDPVTFGKLTILPKEKVQIGYILKVGTGVPYGIAINKARAYASGSKTDIASNQATAQVTVKSDAVVNDTTLIGKVFHDRDGDGYQDSANATGIKVISGKWSKKLSDIKGRKSRLDDPMKRIVKVVIPATGASKIKVMTSEGSVIMIDKQSLQQTESHNGLKAKGLSAEDLRVIARKVGKSVELVITNHGIQEEGIPGVRLATVGGLLIETDGYGRYHIPDVDGGRRSMGKNFILKVDKATLPEGARFTTENPRVLRITGSALNKINFGVKLPRQAAPQRHIQQGAVYKKALRKHVTKRTVPVYQSVDVNLGSIFFDKDKYHIRPNQRGIMDDIANKIERYRRGHITIDAFTDSRHNAQYNIKLAERRANTVRAELHKRLGSKLMRQVKVEVDPKAYKEVPHNDPRAIDYKQHFIK